MLLVLGLRTGTETWTVGLPGPGAFGFGLEPSLFLVFQLADSGPWDLSVSKIM